MNKFPWKDLPNAAEIDRVLAAFKARPNNWEMAYHSTYELTDSLGQKIQLKDLNDAYVEVRNKCKNLNTNCIVDVALIVRHVSMNAAWNCDELQPDAMGILDAMTAAQYVVRNAIFSLIAWNDCSHLLDIEPDQVFTMALLGHTPSIVLLPAVTALHHE
jgi:hypothetical protein